MIEIPLTQGQVALIDDEDLGLVGRYRWYAAWNPHTQSFYAQTNAWLDDDKKHTLRMHRLLLGNPKNVIVDHIDHDTLNNTRANLRLSTNKESSMNRRRRKDNASGYKGVRLDKRYGVWIARIQTSHGRKDIGRYRTAEEAYAAYCAAALEHHGEFARLT